VISRRTEKICIYCLFFLSGISGLIYEIVWLRVLGRVLGNTVFATATILAVFMTGLALGSWIIGKLVDKRKNLLRLYAVLELCIGLAALIMYLFFDKLIPLYQLIFTTFGEDRLMLTSFQVALLFVLILVPTSLMGGTLPILSAHTRKYGVSFARRIGNLYGLNTLGAVVGVMGSGLLLIGAWGESNTLITGVIINLLVSLMAFFLAKPDVEPSGNQGMKNMSGTDSVISPYPPRVQKTVLMAYALSGLTAVAYEIVWTRMLQLHLGSSIYAFSMMLGIYLLGVALGSAVGAKFANKLSNPLGFFGVVQIFIALYCILNLYLFTLFHPVAFRHRHDTHAADSHPHGIPGDFPLWIALSCCVQKLCGTRKKGGPWCGPPLCPEHVGRHSGITLLWIHSDGRCRHTWNNAGVGGSQCDHRSVDRVSIPSISIEIEASSDGSCSYSGDPGFGNPFTGSVFYRGSEGDEEIFPIRSLQGCGNFLSQ